MGRDAMAGGVQFIPPFNFGWVEEDLYRCGHPTELNFPFVETLNLKTVIYLASETPSWQLTNFIEDQEVELVNLGMEGSKLALTTKPISEEVILRGLDIILDADKYPLCIMDTQGRHRVGTLVGCLRKLQKWNLTAILEEYGRNAGSKPRPAVEQFIELFDTDLVSIPAKRPLWL